MRVIGWYGEDLGGKRQMRRVNVGSFIDPLHPLRSIIEAAHAVYTTTGNRPERVELTEAEWALIEESAEVCNASRFCYREERPARDVVAAVTGLTVEVGRPAWQE